jgi:hypothetical protein
MTLWLIAERDQRVAIVPGRELPSGFPSSYRSNPVAGVTAIVGSRAVVHAVFTLPSAALVLRRFRRGVNFNEDDKLCYLDFVISTSPIRSSLLG